MSTEQNITGDAILDGVEAPYEVPPMWTPEHVAHRMVHAFEVLLVMGGRVGPGRMGSTWPKSLQDFADLTCEQDMEDARQAFAESRRRPRAHEIGMSEEALSWPIQYVAHEPMGCDAILLWSFCKAGGHSIADVLRARTSKAKRRATVMQDEENKRVALDRKKAIVAAGEWRDEMAAKMNIAAMPEPEKSEQWAALTEGMRSRISSDLGTLKPKIMLPFHAVPEKILSRTSLDRYLPAGLCYLSERLHAAGVVVR